MDCGVERVSVTTETFRAKVINYKSALKNTFILLFLINYWLLLNTHPQAYSEFKLLTAYSFRDFRICMGRFLHGQSSIKKNSPAVELVKRCENIKRYPRLQWFSFLLSMLNRQKSLNMVGITGNLFIGRNNQNFCWSCQHISRDACFVCDPYFDWLHMEIKYSL